MRICPHCHEEIRGTWEISDARRPGDMPTVKLYCEMCDEEIEP